MVQDSLDSYSSFIPSYYNGADFSEEVWIMIHSASVDDAYILYQYLTYSFINPAGTSSLKWVYWDDTDTQQELDLFDIGFDQWTYLVFSYSDISGLFQQVVVWSGTSTPMIIQRSFGFLTQPLRVIDLNFPHSILI